MNDYLKITQMANEVREMYSTNSGKQGFRLLMLGGAGSGKTYFLRTCRKPVWIDSFDPGGTVCLEDYIKSGEVIADTRYEFEDPLRPTAFNAWKKEMARRTKENLWSHIGTYCIDSATMWSEAIMNWVQSASGKAGEAPRFTKDYVPQKVQIRNWIRAIMKDVCSDFVLTGHLRTYEDQVTGSTSYRFMTTGQGMVIIPLLFDEIWVALKQKKAGKLGYQVLTEATGVYEARSRLSKDGRLDEYEKPDMKYLMEKAGQVFEDKPLIKGE